MLAKHSAILPALVVAGWLFEGIAIFHAVAVAVSAACFMALQCMPACAGFTTGLYHSAATTGGCSCHPFPCCCVLVHLFPASVEWLVQGTRACTNTFTVY